MGIRTDLALESAQAINATIATPYPGISQNEYDKAEFHISQITVQTEDAAKSLGKPMGEYITIETSNQSGLEMYPEISRSK